MIKPCDHLEEQAARLEARVKQCRSFVEELDGMDCDPREAQLLGVDVLLRAVHPEIREAYFRFLERMGCDYEWDI